jgi:hypothetical protein
VSFATITLCVASQRVIPKASVYFVIDSVRKLSDTLSYDEVTNVHISCVCGTVNRHNFRLWGSENPQDVAERERDSPRSVCGAL